MQSLTQKVFVSSVPGPVPFLMLRCGLTDDTGRKAASEDPVLDLVTLNPILLPSPRSEESCGDVGKAAGDETPI